MFLSPTPEFLDSPQRVDRFGAGGLASGVMGGPRAAATLQSSEPAAVVEFYPKASLTSSVLGQRVREARGVFILSPLNPSWPAFPARFDSADQDTRRANLESRRRSLRWNESAIWPSTMEWQVRLTGEPQLSWRAQLSEYLVASLRFQRGPVQIYCDLIDSDEAPNLLDEVAQWPRAVPLLNGRALRFADLMVAPLSLAERIAAAIGHAGVIVAEGADGPFGIISLPSSQGRAGGLAGSRDLLIPRTEEWGPRQPDESRGEFRIGTRMCYSARRVRELLRGDAVPPEDARYCYCAVITPEYCALMGINHDEMLAHLWPRASLATYQAEVARLCPLEAGPTTQEVWDCHRQAYRAVYRSDEVLQKAAQLLGGNGQGVSGQSG